MAQSTVSPNAVASMATKVAKRPVTAKQIRGIARDHIARFDKVKHPAYQSHDYSAAEVRTILAVFAARAKGAAPSRATAKARTTTRAKARTAKVATSTPASDAS